MIGVVTKIDSAVLKQAQQQYDESMTDENRIVRDPVITPFGMAMTLSGYTQVMKSGCNTLRSCTICPVGKGSYSAKYTKNGEVVWGCPHCGNISEQ